MYRKIPNKSINPPEIPSIQLTVYQNSSGLIGKEYWRGGVRPDGNVPGLYYPTKGTYTVVSVSATSELMPLRRRLGVSPSCCIVYGVPPKESGEFCPEEDLKHRPTCITRSLKFHSFPKGQPAFFFGDIDMHGVDPAILKALGVDPNDILSLDRAICKAFPQLAEVERGYDLGNSAALDDKTTGEQVKGFGSWRLFFAVDDASKLPNVMALFYSDLWKQGFGYIKSVVNQQGLLLLYDRTLIDSLTVSPERVDFLSPILPEGCGLKRREVKDFPLILPGKPMLETADLPDIGDLKAWRKSSPEIAKAKEPFKAEQDERKQAAFEKAKDRLRAENPNPEATNKELRAKFWDDIDAGVRPRDYPLTFEDGTVADVECAVQMATMLGGSVKLRDVDDPTYDGGRQVAQLYINEDTNTAFIWSLHYDERYDVTNVLRALQMEGKLAAPPPPLAVNIPAGGAAGGKKAIERQTDLGNARRLIRMYGLDIRFVHAWKKWLLWDGKGWAIDTNGGVMRLAKATIESLHAEAQTEADEDRRKKARQYASSCEAVRRLRGMIELAESEESVTLDPQAIDADPWLLGVQNGVLELKTGTFRPARHEDYILNQAGVSYDANATCPEWLKFLEKFVVDKERISYLQRVAGYILTGLVREEALFLLFGKGRNGKSTFREILFAMLGTYATIGDVTLIMERKQSGGGPTPEVDRLRGKRLVTINETEENAVLRDERIKAISSNDHLTARALYEGFNDFMPTHKTVITTNHKPIVKGSDDGIWARLHPLRFGVKIAPEEEAKDYRERVLVPELAGILNWALAGLKEYVRVGLKAPAAVEKERTEYRHEMDRVGQWLEDRCGDDLDKGDDATETLVSLLYADYELHSKSKSGFAVSKTRFGRELGERGYAWVKRGGKKYRKGLRLLYTMPGGDVLVKPAEKSATGDVVAGPWPKAS